MNLICPYFIKLNGVQKLQKFRSSDITTANNL